MTTHADFENFYTACVEALYFTDAGPDDEASLDSELAPETAAQLRADCLSFWSRMWFYIDGEKTDKTAAQAGHDFWLTRNGHGAGFWDGDWPRYGDMLTRLAKGYGEVSPYLGDDGLIYF